MDARPFISTHQPIFFPESSDESPWDNTTRVKRYYLQFPLFPFRTLNPRSVNLLSSKLNEFDATSPLFPANAQMNILFQKRKKSNFLNSMLPFQLDPNLGAQANKITAEKRKDTCTIKLKAVVNGVEQVHKWVITRVDIDVKDMYLQVIYFTKMIITFFIQLLFGAGCSFEIQGTVP